MTDTAFDATVDIQVSYGRYIWCGNLGSPTSSGFKLTDQTHGDSYGVVNRYMMTLKIHMNSPLFLKTHYIEVRDCNGCLVHYSWQPLTRQTYTHTTVLGTKLLESEELRVSFVIPKLLTDDERTALRGRRHPMNVIHEMTTTVPNMKLYNSDECNDCNICLETIESDENKHVTPCGHMYHSTCIWQYLQPRTRPIHPNCSQKWKNGKQSCCNTTHVVGAYECPVCSHKIEK